MSRRKPSRTSLTSNKDSQSETSSSESGVFFTPGRKFMKNSKVKLKLIALYADHECLWNQCNKDFFNFEHKERVWEAIADEMTLDSPPDFWKHEMHRLRYNVELERLQEQQAKSLGQKFKAKLFYAANLNFLNRMFVRDKVGAHREIPLLAPSSGVTLEKFPSKQTGAVKEKPKPATKLADKLASLEVLRNHHCSRLVLSQEAFRKMQKITSGVVDHHHVAKEKAKPKAKHV